MNSNNPSSTYIISGGQAGSDRLSVLFESTWSNTFTALNAAGIASGMRCLDVGCGNGAVTFKLAELVSPKGRAIGIDMDSQIISIAQSNIPSGIETAPEFRCLDVSAKDSIKNAELGHFDFILARFILSHVPNPSDLISTLRSLLNPKGILLVEDVDFEGHFSHPKNAAFDSYIGLYQAAARAKGADPLIGPKIPALLEASGFLIKNLNCTIPTFRSGPGKQMAILTLQNIGPSLIQSGLLAPDSFGKLLKELTLLTESKDSILSLPRIFQVSCSAV